MRLWPRSMAGRTSLVLIAGMVVILCLGAAAWSLSLFGEAGPRQNFRQADRIANLAVLLDRTPTAVRVEMLAGLQTSGFRAAWSSEIDQDVVATQDWFTRHLETHLRRALARRGADTVLVGHVSEAAGGTAPMLVGPILVRLRLADGTWLDVFAEDSWHDPWRLIGFLSMIVVVGGGLTGLAVWVSRRVTAPLGRFSIAAARLGTDVDAPPLPEIGPSEIREAAQTFNQMQQRIRRFIEDRALMLAAISHDLGTMLTRFRLRIEFIEDGEQRTKAAADLEEMQAMLNEAIAFARDLSAAEPRTRVDLAGLLRTLADDLADAGQPVSFDGPPHCPFPCRPAALRRACANLIDNAVKYGGEAEVGLAKSGEDVVITVADRGPGIPEAAREKVFDPFFRLEGSRSRETGGTGLGLAVARNAVRRHGGDIALADRPGGGLVVRISLPEAEPA